MSEILPLSQRTNYDGLTLWRSGLLVDLNNIKITFPGSSSYGYDNTIVADGCVLVEVFLIPMNGVFKFFGGVTRMGYARLGNDFSVADPKTGNSYQNFKIGRRHLTPEDINIMRSTMTTRQVARLASGTIKKTDLFDTPEDVCVAIAEKMRRDLNSKKKDWEMLDPNTNQLHAIIPDPKDLRKAITQMHTSLGKI